MRSTTVAGYARGEETRRRIIRAAVELFGKDGFDRISTRDIAARAGVAAPVLQYYFDGKEGLYTACVEHVEAHANGLLQPVIDTVRRQLAAPVSRDALIESVCYIYEQVAGYLLTDSERHTWTGSAASDGSLRHQLLELLCELVGRIIGKSPQDEQTRIRVVTLGGQLAVFHQARPQTLADIGWARVNARELRVLRAIVRAQTEAVLRSAVVKKGR